MKERLIELRKHLELTQGEFGKQIDLTHAMISMIESGKKNLQDSTVKLICYTFKVNEKWLRDGTGDMMDAAAELSDYQKRLLKLFNSLSPTAQKLLIDYAEGLVKYEEALRGPEKRDIV